MKTRMIIVAAPSGGGKSSFVERAIRDFPMLEDTVTYTTREMRHHESQGHPYFFVSDSEFQSLLEKNFFVEHARVHGNMYGTPYEQLEKAWDQGKTIIMDVDIQGVETFKSKYPDAKTIFILPPSIDELRRRVIKRDGREPANMDVRMANAEKEIARAGEFDYQIVNDIFDISYARFKKIVEELIA